MVDYYEVTIWDTGSEHQEDVAKVVKRTTRGFCAVANAERATKAFNRAKRWAESKLGGATRNEPKTPCPIGGNDV